MNDGKDCDVSDFIPEGCHECGEKAREYCQSGSGKISSYSYMKFFQSILSKKIVNLEFAQI